MPESGVKAPHLHPQLVGENAAYSFLELMKNGSEETSVVNKETQSVALVSPEAMARARVWAADASLMPLVQIRPVAPSSSSRMRLSHRSCWGPDFRPISLHPDSIPGRGDPSKLLGV